MHCTGLYIPIAPCFFFKARGQISVKVTGTQHLQLLPQEAFKNKEVNRTIKRQRGYTESVDVSIVTVLASIMSCKL